MWYQISQFRTPLEFNESELPVLLIRTLNLPDLSVKSLKIRRKSLDARHKDPAFVYTLLFEINNTDYELESVLTAHPNVTVYQPVLPQNRPLIKQRNSVQRPVIVGSGPAGLFAGFILAKAGLRPVILERGDGLAERIQKVNQLWLEEKLDPESNIQFGIGGAGTFSDGKLTTRVKDPRVGEILDILVRLGAPPEISYWQYPHIGTDLLREVVTSLQRMICDLGGEFHFRSCLTDIGLHERRVNCITINHQHELSTDRLVLATGNSARDVYQLLIKKGCQLMAKPFAIGLRIEHPQDLIDQAQYGRWSGHAKLGPAEYHLTYKHPASGRGVYSFCMCPGGMVIGATSIPDGVVTNGMSFHARDSGVANAAIIVTVNEYDYGTQSELAGLHFQEALEKKAFQMGGGHFYAPAQRVGDFLHKKATESFVKLIPSYRPGVTAVNLWELLPPMISQALSDGINYFGTQLKGFDWADATLTGVETRTSAPVRIVRNESHEALGLEGLYPAGEGAGYAGGIISSALDGWKTAEIILQQIG